MLLLLLLLDTENQKQGASRHIKHCWLLCCTTHGLNALSVMDLRARLTSGPEDTGAIPDAFFKQKKPT